VFECRYFGGLGEEQTAEALGLSLRTVQRDWNSARSWLQERLS
jgi:DNA-directed RNA polymerase specialized sigma24 family protein